MVAWKLAGEVVMLMDGVAFAFQVNKTFLSSTAPVCGAKTHGAAFTIWSSRIGHVALELKGRHSPLFDTLSRYEGARR